MVGWDSIEHISWQNECSLSYRVRPWLKMTIIIVIIIIIDTVLKILWEKV